MDELVQEHQKVLLGPQPESVCVKKKQLKIAQLEQLQQKRRDAEEEKKDVRRSCCAWLQRVFVSVVIDSSEHRLAGDRIASLKKDVATYEERARMLFEEIQDRRLYEVFQSLVYSAIFIHLS